ncbi:hypothetical protein [Sphingobacterium faecium]|uniref:hypothetical protein n=1 Tax=Sphingobacterium faecium TaxID=34087 RepID=UPI00320ADEED
MITLKNTRLFVATLFALIIGAFYIVNAMDKQSETKEPKTSTTWYFQGSSLAQAEDASNYSQIPHPNCNVGTALPCELPVEDAPDEESLQTFLNGKSGSDIRDTYAVSKRN